jgi:DNA-binding MurR/RpiR family transcriptional regulator
LGCKVIAITGSVLAPIAEGAAMTFLVREAEVYGFRSMSATTCLVQSLAIGCAARATKAGAKP